MSARRSDSLLSEPVSVRPGGGQDVASFVVELGKAAPELRLGRSGLLEQFAGLRLHGLRLSGGKLEDGPDPLAQSVRAGSRCG